MSDLQILIENIRTAISFPETVPPEQMRTHARSYAEACTELNRRMLQCIQHIRAGNIAEGIRMAELKPNLPEMYLLLDMPERDDWDEIVSTLGFDQPLPLPAELSRELNEAYLKISPLEPLLRWHRLYALNGSSIVERLGVLRAIARTDHENMFWIEDQENFEKVRLKEIEKEIPHAIATKNALKIRELHAELSVPDWIIKPPPEHRRILTSAVLEDYANTLMGHFNVFDQANASNVYAMMQQVLFAEQMAMPPGVQQLIRPAVQWLGETQRQNTMQIAFDRAAAALHDALSEETALPTLELLYYTLGNAAAQAGMSIPAELEELYQAEVTRLHTVATRRNRLIVLSIVAACVLLGGVLAWGLHLRLHSGRVRDTLASLQKIETENRFEDIPGTLERIETNSPEIAKNAEVIAAMQRLRTMLANDEIRAEDFARYYSLADARFSAAEKPEFPELTQIKISVDQAERLARSPQEQTRYSELKRKYDSAFSMRKREIDEKYSNALAEVSDELNTLRRDNDLSTQEAIARLKETARRVALLQQSPDVSDSLKEQGTAVAGMVVEFQRKMERKQDLDNALKNLFSLVPDWTNYEAALRRFPVDFPDHPAADDAGDVLKELEEIKETALLIHDLAGAYSRAKGNFDVLREESADLLKKYQVFSSRISGSPSDLFPPGNSLEELSKMLPYTSGTFRSTESLLRSLSQRDVFPWVDEKGQWYYFTRKPDRPNSYGYITTFISEEKNYRIRDGEFNPAKVPVVTQQEFSRDALKRIDGIKDAPEIVACNLLSELLQKRKDAEPGLDPILQCVLVDLLLTDMSKIDPFFASHFKRAHEIIQKSGVDLMTNWMDVQSRNTIPQRNMARAAINRLPEIKPLLEAIRRDHARFKESLAQSRPRFEWIGSLMKKDGQWDCPIRSGIVTANAGDLYVFRQKADRTLQPIRIGQVASGKVEFHGNESSLLQCLPVFLIEN